MSFSHNLRVLLQSAFLLIAGIAVLIIADML